MTVGAVAVDARWYVLWTRCESLVHQQLVARGFRLFNRQLNRWSRRAEPRHLIQAPMFPGYIFLQHTLDKESDLAVRKARGLVTIHNLGKGLLVLSVDLLRKSVAVEIDCTWVTAA
jgi:hypothetical protein